jgi:hypothetical protein
MVASPDSRLLIVLLAAALGLASCGGDMDDLDSYINEVKARPGGRIEPLPEITPYEVFTYVADSDGLRSPFVPDAPQAAPGAVSSWSSSRWTRYGWSEPCSWARPFTASYRTPTG